MSKLTGLVREVVGGNPSVMGAFVFDGDGQVEASAGTDPDLLGVAVALFVPMRDMLERTSASLGCGEMRSTLMQGSKATLAVTDVDGMHAVAVMGIEGAPPGPLLADAAYIARALRSGAST